METLRLSRRVVQSCRLCQSLRYASNKSHEKREQRKQTVVEYQSVKADPAERVYVWGHAATGALGARTYLRPEKKQKPITIQNRPARLRFMDENHYEVYDVSCGYGFTLFAAVRNRRHLVLATGLNTDSQLGYYEFPKKSGRVLDYIIEPVPVAIPGINLDNHKSKLHVSAGRAHSMIQTDVGVFSQGNNAYGQCGRPTVEGEIFHKVSNIQKIEDIPKNIKKVVCGQDHTLFLTEDGQVYSCGLSADGQTGLETFKSVGIPQRLKGDIDGVKIIDIASKADCVLAASENGEVFGWGNSEYSQLSMVTSETQVNVPRHLPIRDCGKITQVATGGTACVILNEQGQVYVWGYGILGQGPKNTNLKTPSLLPPALFGQNELQPKVKVTSIKCGMGHFAAITDIGDMYVWGKGRYGCLGLPKMKIEEQFFPLKVSIPALAHTVDLGVDHTVVLCSSFT